MKTLQISIITILIITLFFVIHNSYASESTSTNHTSGFVENRTVQYGPKLANNIQNESTPLSHFAIGQPILLSLTSPLKQFKSGIKAEDVKCNTGLILAINRNYLPACVTKPTAENLLLRGWVIGFAHYIPVYFVEPDSASQITVKYFPLHLKDQTPPDIILQLNSRVYKSDASFPTNEVNATATPKLIHTQSDTTVNYTITTYDTRGVYWLELEYQCNLIPIVVGIDQSQLTTSDLQNPSGLISCPPAETQFHVASLSNVTLKLIGVD